MDSRQFAILLLIGITLIGCNSHSNKKYYEIGIGEEVKIYYSTNSCCYYCAANEKMLKHVRLSDRIVVKEGMEDCDGCNYEGAFVFRAESPGIDTVELKLLTANVSCDSNNVQSEKYLIEVK